MRLGGSWRPAPETILLPELVDGLSFARTMVMDCPLYGEVAASASAKTGQGPGHRARRLAITVAASQMLTRFSTSRGLSPDAPLSELRCLSVELTGTDGPTSPRPSYG